VATEAAKRNIKVFVHEGSAHDYINKPNYEPATETDPLEERTTFSKYRVLTDKALQAIPGLNLVVLRCGLLYGPTYQGAMSIVYCCAEKRV
jgi:nucleoside-diphosphate-sugar epimerase